MTLGHKLESLGVRFIERTACEVESLYAQLEQARCGGEEPLALLARIAHGIHGTGASFGFVKVSQCAGAIELRIKQQRAANSAPCPEFFAELRDLIAHLERCVIRAVSAFAAADSSAGGTLQ